MCMFGYRLIEEVRWSVELLGRDTAVLVPFEMAEIAVMLLAMVEVLES